jgi:predicted permease
VSWRDGLRHRLHVWLHAEKYAREQLEELRFHRAMEAADSRLRDTEPLPHLPSLQEDRFMFSRLMDWLRQDVGYAIRTLGRSPAFTAVAVLTLGLGVGANGAVFSVLDRLIGHPPAGVTDPHNVWRLYIQVPNHPTEPGMVFAFWNYPAYSAVDDAVGEAAAVAAWTPSSESVVKFGDAELTARVSYATHHYFSVLGVRPALGRLFGADEERVEVPSPVAVLTHGFWRRAFGSDPAVLGRTLDVNGTGFVIIGVAQDGFTGLDLSVTDIFFPVSTYPGQGQLGLPWYQWIGNYFHAVARVPDAGSETVLAHLATAGYHRQVLPERGAAPVDSSNRVVPGSIIAARGIGREAGTPEQRQAVAISIRAAGVSALVLLIACANVAGLALVRTARRRREIAVRLALGISRTRLAAQLLIEGLLLGALGAGVALLLGVWGGGVLRALLTPDVAWGTGVLDRRLLVLVIATALAVGTLSSLAPMIQGVRASAGAGLKSGDSRGPARTRFQSGLLAAQAALSVVLLVGAGLFIESLRNVNALRLGFDLSQLAWINPGQPLDRENAGQALEDAASSLAGMAGVAGVALARVPPMLGWGGSRVYLPGGDTLPELAPGAYPAGNTVSPEFFAVTGMQIRQGRAFVAGEDAVVVVSETMARTIWPGEGAIGKCLIFGEPTGPCHTVVGVAEDSRRMRIVEEPALQYFQPRTAGSAGGVILLRVDPPRWDAVAAGARQVLERSFNPRTGRLARMAESLEPQMRPWRLGAQLFTAFGTLALLVTLVGVYGVMAYAVSQRTHEIGVRMAIGARPGDVLRLILGEGVAIVGVGVLIGIALALALGRLVDALLYGVTPREPSAIIAAAAILLLTAATASLVPAWRASRVDPFTTLREE